MSKNLRLILAALLVVIGLFGEKTLEILKDNIDVVNTPSVDISEPSLSYKTLVQPIVDINIEGKDAKQLRDFFMTVSDVVESDPGFIETTGIFSEFNKTSGGLNFSGLELKNKYPTLGEEIDTALARSIGLEDIKLTVEKRKDLCDCLDAIAWGVGR